MTPAPSEEQSAMPKFSVVSPVYKAEECVDELYRRLVATLGAITDDFEIILVEDSSPDRSWQRIEEIARRDSRVRGIKLSRNFGQHVAISAGIDLANGDWVIVMDCDLQDPPEQIAALYGKAQEGFDVVVASFTSRAESNRRQVVSRNFWAFLSWLSGTTFDHRAGNFRIMSREVVLNFRRFQEHARYFGGIVSLIGFRTTTLPMQRESRFAGETAYSVRGLLSVAVTVILAHSVKPLRLSIGLGLCLAALSFIAAVWIVVLSLVGSVAVSGWASLMVALFFVGGVIIFNLGLIGYYIGQTFEEVKGRPLYFIERSTFEPERPAP